MVDPDHYVRFTSCDGCKVDNGGRRWIAWEPAGMARSDPPPEDARYIKRNGEFEKLNQTQGN